MFNPSSSPGEGGEASGSYGGGGGGVLVNGEGPQMEDGADSLGFGGGGVGDYSEKGRPGVVIVAFN